MNIKQLRYFLATVDHGNMTRAADSLHIAQPALSQQIAGLERDLGSKLIERNVRGIRPTAAGEVLYRHAKGLLRHVEDLKGAVSFERQHPSGRVAIGVSGGVARLVLVPLLAALRAYPGVLVEVIVRQSSGISLEDLAAMPLVLPSAPNATRTRIDLAFLNANLNYQLVAEISAPDLLILLVESGEACSVLPWSAIHREVAQQRLQAVPLLPLPITREISLCASDDVQPSEAGVVVRQLMLDLLDTLHRNGDWQGCEKIAASR